MRATTSSRRYSQTVIASEAKQSSFVVSIMDCFVASLLAMTAWLFEIEPAS
jgi:hypothetical protein